MILIFKKCDKFFPLFLGTICIVLMGLDLLPGRLPWYINTEIYAKFDEISQYVIFCIVLPIVVLIGLPLLCILAIYEVIQLFWFRQSRHRFSGILSLLMLIFTGSALSFDLPTRIYFFTHLPQYEQDLSQASNGGRKNFYVQTISFIPVDSPPQMAEEYGFAYLPNLSKTYYRTTHIYGKWYIFSGQNVDYGNPDPLKSGPDSFKRGE
jgi:hypothetical protein